MWKVADQQVSRVNEFHRNYVNIVIKTATAFCGRKRSVSDQLLREQTHLTTKRETESGMPKQKACHIISLLVSCLFFFRLYNANNKWFGFHTYQMTIKLVFPVFPAVVTVAIELMAPFKIHLNSTTSTGYDDDNVITG